MSAWAQGQVPAFDAPQRQLGRSASLPLRLTAFFGFTAFASIQFSTLILHPPGGRVMAAAGVVTAGAAALALCGRARLLLPSPRLVHPIATLITLLTFVLGVLAVGVPAHLLAPAHWGTLGADVRRGFDGLSGWLWPYRGDHRWARLDVLAVLPFAGTAAAAVSFWPSGRRERLRGALGLCPLVAVFLGGVVNEVAPLWRFQGVVLLVLIFAWFCLPTLRAQDVNRAVRWLLACTAMALAVAPLLSSARPWIDYTGWDPVPATTTFQWDQLYGPNTWSRSTATMLEVAQLHPHLLRIATLDRFDGLRFLRSQSPPGLARLDQPPGRHRGQWYERATVTLAGLRSSLLVGGGGTPTWLRWLGGGAPVSRQADGTLSASTPLAGGSRYDVISYEPHPSRIQMQRAGRSFPPAYLRYTQLQLPARGANGLLAPNLRLEARARVAPSRLVGAPAPGRSPATDVQLARRIEASPYAGAFALARRLARGAHSNYAVAARIKAYLRGSYTYSLDPPRSRYPLESFLFSARRGYCQQFSGAMTLLLRLDGIPARVAVGFQPGVYDLLSQQWRVRALDAHAWVEVYLDRIGWVTFDPTPPAATAEVHLGLQSKLVTLGLRGGHSGGVDVPSNPGRAAKAGAANGGIDGWLLGAAVALAAMAAVAGGRWLAGRKRLYSGLRDGGAGAVRELADALRRLGYETQDGLTLAQLESRLSRRGSAGDSAARYLALLRVVRYGRGTPQLAAALAERRALRRALSGRGPVGLVRALLALPPGVARRPARRSGPLSRP